MKWYENYDSEMLDVWININVMTDLVREFFLFMDDEQCKI
jgi:hypothetical protein